MEDATSYRIGLLEKSQNDIAESLKALVRLEQHHADTREGLARAWKQIEAIRDRIGDVEDKIPDKLEDRLLAIEKDMPGLKEAARWLKMGVIAVVGAALTFVWSEVTQHRDHAPVEITTPER